MGREQIGDKKKHNGTYMGVDFKLEVWRESKDGGKPYWTGFVKCNGQLHGRKCSAHYGTTSQNEGHFKSESAAKRFFKGSIQRHIESRHKN